MQKHCQTQNYVQNHINITELSLCEPLLLLCVYAPLPPWHGRRLRGCKGGGAAPCALGLALHLPQFHIKFENCGVPLPVTILLRCIKVSHSRIPRCMACRRGLAMRILSVGPFVCPSVRLSNAWIVTKRKKDLSRFLYRTKEHLACRFSEKKNGWWVRLLLP